MIGEPINEELLARIEEKQADLMPMGGGPMASMRRKPAQATIQADYDTLLGLASAMRELDIELTALICSHSLKAIESPNADVTYYAKEKDRLDLYQTLHGPPSSIHGREGHGLFERMQGTVLRSARDLIAELYGDGAIHQCQVIKYFNNRVRT